MNKINFESMHPELSAPSPQRSPFKGLRPVRLGRWSVPLLATIAIGYGVTTYISKTQQQDSPAQLAEAERLRKNQQLMDAYGYKDNVDDLQKALEAYEVQ
ncbi:hypothetical protein BJY01DRAFT_217400 [Aspergillus pseudoustus]|uniref:Cytochrome c oxidase assembly protein n=1 Tax=Aspergillus pseudoustus TaxID=1810923 RepID=A0ABR4JMZ8_9EURO